MRVATLLRAPATHSASSFALAALSLKGVKSAFNAFGAGSAASVRNRMTPFEGE